MNEEIKLKNKVGLEILSFALFPIIYESDINIAYIISVQLIFSFVVYILLRRRMNITTNEIRYSRFFWFFERTKVIYFNEIDHIKLFNSFSYKYPSTLKILLNVRLYT